MNPVDETPVDWYDRVIGRFRNTRERRESLMLLRAVRLASDLETCEEILRTGRVPRSRLDAHWAQWYGL